MDAAGTCCSQADGCENEQGGLASAAVGAYPPGHGVELLLCLRLDLTAG